MTYPYSDADMTYNEATHRYTLTVEFVARETGADLLTVLNNRGIMDRTALANNYLREISSVIYSQIYASSTQSEIKEYLAAKHPAAREILKQAMLEQVLYTLSNGDIANLSGIDVRRGVVVDRRALAAARIAPLAEEALNRQLDATTPSLLYRGHLYSLKRLPAYESEGY